MTSEWITTYGSTVDEAVAAALKKLQATEDEVEIVVVRQPRQGFLGLWRWQAEVRVRRRPQQAPAAEEEAAAAVEQVDEAAPPPAPVLDQPGTIAVHDGKVYVNPSSDPGEELIISPGEHVEVRVNGHVLDGPLAVGAEDVVEVRAVDTLPATEIHVQISDDEYTASVSVAARPGVRYRVADSPPGKSITVRAEPGETLPPRPPSLEELEAALSRAGVVYGVSREALQAVIDAVAEDPAAGEDPRPVAFGVPAEPTVDERIELSFDPAPRVRVEVDTDQADLLGLYKLTSVAPGDVLAVVHPGVKGKPGRTVKGREVPVTEPRSVQLKVGAGAEWQEDKKTVVAQRGGRPTFLRNTIAVHPQHTVAGDVDPSTGHVEFDGDVVVSGNVNDSMRVVSRGTVSVGGGVTDGFVEALEGVAVGRGIVRSTVVAGARYSRLFQLMGYFQPLNEDLPALVEAATQLQSNPQTAPAELRSSGIGGLVRWLLDDKFSDVAKRVDELYWIVHGDDSRWLSKDQLDTDLLQLVNGLHGLLAGLSPLSIKSLDQITELQRQLANVIREFDDQPKELFDVSAGFVHNSDVLAAGRIIVHSGGCAYSRLWSGTGVKIESGVFRGSTLTVHAGNVVIKEVGSRAASPTRIEIVTEGAFRAGFVHAGVVVAIGNRSHTFRNEAVDVRVRLVDGELRVQGS